MRRLLSATLTVIVTVGVVAVPAILGPAGADVPAASTFTPLTPVRVLDTRDGAGTVGARGTISVSLAERLPADATAAVLTVTAADPTAGTYVTVSPHRTPRPTTSSLNVGPGETRSNLVTVAVGADRAVDLYNHAGDTHLVADLSGYYSTGAGSRFTPRPADRLPPLRPGPGGELSLDLSSRVPESATAVVLNVTGTRPTADTYVSVFPAGAARPVASTLNLTAGRTSANLAVVPLGPGQRVTLYNRSGTVDLYADLAGFYTPEFGALFTSLPPVRVFDTRTGRGAQDGMVGPLRTGRASVLPGQLVPDDAIAALLNLTGVEPTERTYLSFEWGVEQGTSNLNLEPGQVAANLVVVPLHDQAPWRRTSLYNNAGSVHATADLAGYFWVPPEPCPGGCARAWGLDMGRLGRGTTGNLSGTPERIAGLTDVTDIADRYALCADGSVWAWGTNADGELGGGWYGGESTVPVPVVGLSDAVAVAAAGDTGWALRADGTVWGWGDNAESLLGPGRGRRSDVPVPVAGLTEVTAIAAGDTTGYALRADGTVWAWGADDFGQLGDGTVARSGRPVRVSGLSGVVAIESGYKTAYALRSDGTVWAWGWNSGGALGHGAQVPYSRVPVRVSGLTDVVDIAAGHGNGYAIGAEGAVWAWGSNSLGELGVGERVDRSFVPVRVPGVRAVDVVGTWATALALDESGQVWAWGQNSYGQHGTGAAGGRAYLPFAVPGLDSVAALYAGESGFRGVW